MGFASADNVLGTGAIGRGAVLGSNAIGSVLYNQGGTFTPTPPNPDYYYLRPDGVSYYLQPDGVSKYKRP
jgi:hypothetical protein